MAGSAGHPVTRRVLDAPETNVAIFAFLLNLA